MGDARSTELADSAEHQRFLTLHARQGMTFEQLERVEQKVDRLLAVLDRFEPALAKIEARLSRKNSWKDRSNG